MTAARSSPSSDAAAAIWASSASSSTRPTIVAYDGKTMRKRQTENDALVEAKEQLDALIKKEAADLEADLQRTVSVARADTTSMLLAAHRRLAEERREELGRAEQHVLTELTGRLIAAQKEIEAKLAAWSQDMERVREGLATQVARLEQRQKQLFTDAESRFTAETE